MDAVSREEFRTYVAARSAGLLRTATLLTGDRGLAEDLVQTALARTYLSWGRIRDREAVDAYTRRIMVTTYATWWRRRWRGEVPAEQLPDRPGADPYAQVDEAAVLVRCWSPSQWGGISGSGYLSVRCDGLVHPVSDRIYFSPDFQLGTRWEQEQVRVLVVVPDR